MCTYYIYQELVRVFPLGGLLHNSFDTCDNGDGTYVSMGVVCEYVSEGGIIITITALLIALLADKN